MSGFMVYWSKDYVKELKSAGDSGPIKVIYGGPHSTMTSIESVEVGDIIYPVTIANNTLCVLARLPVENKEIAFHYVLRETGEIHKAIKPDGYAEEVINHNGNIFFFCEGHAYNSVKALPENTKVIYLSDLKELPHKYHQKPKTCCAELAAWGEHGSTIELRSLPLDVLPSLRFGKTSKQQKPLILNSKGIPTTMSLSNVRRMSEETQKIFESLFKA